MQSINLGNKSVWLAGWLAVRLACLLTDWLAAWLAAWLSCLDDRLAGWRTG